MKPREYTPEEAARIEQHTQSEFEEKAARRDHYRTARRVRIAEGIVEQGDLVDEHDVVCPYCGAWEEGDQSMVFQSAHHFARTCTACERSFVLEIRVRYSFITEAEL